MALMRILHAHGDLPATLALAAHPAVDAVQLKVWVRAGSALMSRARPLGPLPVTLGRRRIHREWRDEVDVRALLAGLEDRARLVLALRSSAGDPAPDIARLLHPLADRSRLIVSCDSWPVADRIQAWLPDLWVAYRVRSEGQLQRYVQGQLDASLPAMRVMVRHELLHSADEVASLRRWAPAVGVWTVDDAPRARALVGWGANTLTSSRVDILAGLG